MAGGVVAVALGQIVPGDTGAQHVENTVEHLAIVGARAAALLGRGEPGLYERPLFVG